MAGSARCISKSLISVPQHAAQQLKQRARREGVRERTWADFDDLGLLGYVHELLPTNLSPHERLARWEGQH